MHFVSCTVEFLQLQSFHSLLPIILGARRWQEKRVVGHQNCRNTRYCNTTLQNQSNSLFIQNPKFQYHKYPTIWCLLLTKPHLLIVLLPILTINHHLLEHIIKVELSQTLINMTVHQDCILQVIIHHNLGHILQHLSTNLINVLYYKRTCIAFLFF